MTTTARATHGIVPDRAAATARRWLAPLARTLHRAGISPNAVTVVGLLITLAGCALLAADRPLEALVVLVVGTLADTLDGALAREAGGGTRLGAFLDSIADRFADAGLWLAALALGAKHGLPLLAWGALAGLVASSLVPYVRAKAESLGLAATVGPAPREARIVLLLLGVAGWALAGEPGLFVAAVIAVAALTTVTLIQRIALVARQLSRSEGG